MRPREEQMDKREEQVRKGLKNVSFKWSFKWRASGLTWFEAEGQMGKV